jgi:copper/silver efflux system protein
MIENLIEYCARNRFIIFVATFFLALWGFWALKNAKLDALPDLSDTQVIIFTEWEGRSPDLVEAQITYPIVTRLVAAPEMKVVRGQSFFGLSFVYAIFEDGTDMYWARSRTLEYINALRDKLPADVSPTLGPDATGVGWVYEYALVDESGQHDLQELRAFQDWNLKYTLESVPGVAEVASVGGFVKQYQVELDPNRLQTYKLPVDRVVTAIRRSNADVGGRAIEFGSTEYMVRGRGYIKSPDDIRNISLGATEGGTPIFLRDVADVKIGAEPRRGLAEYNGQGEVVGGIVIARYGENAFNVIKDVKEKLAAITDSLPAGVKVVTTYDRSDLIQRAIDSLRKALVEELIVVAIFIIIFLLHVRSALVPIISLPLAVLASFIPIYYMGLTVNIMSLGGIIIAVGAMVDAAIIFVENAHKKLEEWEEAGRPGSRMDALISGFREVGGSIFASLLVLTVSFIPVFTLEAQEGRLFKPLAFGKTFAMFFAAILSVTLVPAIGVLLIRGKIRSEEKHPISRFLHWIYSPVLYFAVRFRKTMILAGILIMATTIPVFLSLGSEFMPPLNEGSILYMPTATPGMSITEAAKILQTQDRILRTFPEVTSVFGKIGRALTPTDPAPLSMVETTILLKPPDEWRTVEKKRWYSGLPDFMKPPLRWIWPDRRPMEWNELIADMDVKLRFPGMPPIWWMPVQTRTEMLSTGIRSNLGIKVFGADREEIEKLSIQIEQALQTVPGTRSAFAERLTGGYFIDYEINREAVARYGLNIADVEDVIETAIGGKSIGNTVEGRERFPITVQYLRELRDTESALERVLVPTPAGAQVPISMLANIRFNTGPHMIQNEDGYQYGVVFVDVSDDDYEGYVKKAQEIIRAQVKLPPGYRLEWTGQYQSLLRMRERLKLVVPVTLFIVFFILYLNFNSWKHTLIVLLAVPFSLVGSIWLLYLLGFNLSVAVWVGMIALAGIDAETGTVMLLYLDLAYDKAKKAGHMMNFADLREAIHEGAVKRLRPKVMTVFTDVIGLMPVMWAASTETGIDVTKRMAAPIVGGLVTSFLLELTIYPAIYAIWKHAEMEGWRTALFSRVRSPFQRRPVETSAPIIDVEPTPAPVMARASRRELILWALGTIILAILAWMIGWKLI